MATVTVRLIKKHRHGGKDYAAGSTLAGLPPKLAEWLRSQGVADYETSSSEITRTSAPIRRASCCGGRW